MVASPNGGVTLGAMPVIIIGVLANRKAPNTAFEVDIKMAHKMAQAAQFVARKLVALAAHLAQVFP